jgi:hypothetical protein
MPDRPPAPPRGLDKRGRALWRSAVDEYEFEDVDLHVLLQACRLSDDLERIAAELEGAPLMVDGHRGVQREHPLLAARRQHAVALGRLLSQLGLPSEEQMDRSAAGRRMARLRWG